MATDFLLRTGLTFQRNTSPVPPCYALAPFLERVTSFQGEFTPSFPTHLTLGDDVPVATSDADSFRLACYLNKQMAGVETRLIHALTRGVILHGCDVTDRPRNC